MHPLRHFTRRTAGWMLTLTCMLLAASPTTAQDGAINSTTGTAARAPEVLMESGTTPERTAAADRPGEAISTKPPASPKISLFIRQYSMQNALDELHGQTGITFEARGKATEPKIDLAVDEVPLEDVLERITKPNNLVWVQVSPTLYRIYDQDTYKAEVISKQTIRKSFQLHYINATELDAIIKPMLQEGIESSTADARTNRLIVQALPDKMSIIQDIVNEFDVQLYSMVFEIQNADTEEIGSRLQEIASEAAEIQIDPVNRVIVVKDTFERIKQMESLVAVLDRDQEIMAYNLNNLGLDGELIDDIVKKFIEPVVTKDALVDYQPKLGRLIIRDVHSVHGKIIELLKSLDTPRKQVLIEGELLSVQVSDNLNFGANWVIANDLKIASENTQPDISIPTLPTNRNGLPAATIASSGLNFLAMGDHVRAQLNAAMSASDTRILLRPRLLIASGEEGNVSIGENQPVLNTYFNNSYGGNVDNNYIGQTASQSLISTGLDITIRPIITNRGLIEMYVSFDNSTPIIVPDIGQGIRGVGNNAQRADTYMLMPSGQTRVIGGLISQNKSRTSAGLPFLSKIPYMGWLFGSSTNDNALRNLMFFITATIIQEEATIEELAEPVNAAARASVAEATQVANAAAPGEIHKIPAELMPYLQSIRPEAVPYSATRTTTSSATQEPVLNETSAAGARAAANGGSLLSDEPYQPPKTGETLRVGGAVPSTTGGTLASKTFGTAKATPAAVKPTPRATAAGRAVSTPRPRITPRGAGVPYMRSTPQARMTPAVTAAPTPAPTVPVAPTPAP